MAPTRSALSYEGFSNVYDRMVESADFFEGRDYYRYFKERYWRTLQYIDRCFVSAEGRILDIGSGQFAVLCRVLWNLECDVADIDAQHTRVLREHGIGFSQIDLTRGGIQDDRLYDLIIMAEVIEHVPRPPHLVFHDLMRSIRPGGALLVTTPNLYRLRNVARMILGRPLFCNFRFPDHGQGLGHFLEYSKEQMIWHLETAGLRIEIANIDQLDLGGATKAARLARRLALPLLSARPLLKDNLVFVARRPSDP